MSNSVSDANVAKISGPVKVSVIDQAASYANTEIDGATNLLMILLHEKLTAVLPPEFASPAIGATPYPPEFCSIARRFHDIGDRIAYFQTVLREIIDNIQT